MDTTKPRAKKVPSASQHEIAKLLFELSDSAFTLLPKKNASYITLDEQVGKSKKHKNAVCILKRGVSFMVSDWHADDEAKRLEIPATRKEEIKKLLFPELTTSVIRTNSSFFQTMLAEAKRESRYRQEH
jgi:hypothetical protein